MNDLPDTGPSGYGAGAGGTDALAPVGSSPLRPLSPAPLPGAGGEKGGEGERVSLADTLAEAALLKLRKLRAPTVQQIEDRLFLEEHLAKRDRLPKVRRELAPLKEH